MKSVIPGSQTIRRRAALRRANRSFYPPGLAGAGALLLLFILAFTGHAAGTFGPFDNGFEGEALPLGGWVVENQTDVMARVGVEGPADFPIYAEWNTAVAPYDGDFMFRLGEPKTQNQTQPRGLNTLVQHFTADANSISIVLRLFSLEPREDDTLRLSLDMHGGSGAPIYPDAPFVLKNNRGNALRSCFNAGERDCPIDVGKRQNYIDTGWQVLDFSGLTVGEDYSISIELEGGQNEALASWLYVDGVKKPPTAVARCNPASPVEGDFVVCDCLQSVDQDSSELSCRWTTPGVQTLVGNTVVYYFPNDATLKTVSLEVTDGENSDFDEASVGIANRDPLVNALDVEVLPGGTVDLTCRFADPGVDDFEPGDAGAFSFDVAAGSVELLSQNVTIETVPALASGIAHATYTAPAGDVTAPLEITGTCTVDESNGPGSGSDTFTITVLPPEALATRVAANTESTQDLPQVLLAGASMLGGLKTPDSIAVYEIRRPDPDFPNDPFMSLPLPAGSEVVITADFPVDYDIVVLSGSADQNFRPYESAPFVSAPFVSAPFVSAPFVSAPFVSAPFVSAPFVSAPFVSAPFVSAPFVSAPFVSAPFVSAPLNTSLWTDPGFVFDNFLLSQLAGAPDGSNISGLDITYEDLGALGSGNLANEPLFVKGMSAEFGTNTELVLVETNPGEKGLFVAVIPQAGSFSAAPFSIATEVAVPLPTELQLGAACDPKDLLGGDISPGPEVLRTGGAETLIVTQRERMMATFGMNEQDWSDWMLAMEPFFASVDAKVISVPNALYADTADGSLETDPCSVQAQNAVATAIKGVIDTHRTPTTKYVQLMGSLDIVPPYYVPDETLIGNEALFASDLLTQPGTPLGVAIGEGYMLTDAYYVDAVPQPFNGRQLYLEDISVSRMVETPEEILANAQRFVATGGQINLLSYEAAGTKATGYDFFIDGTEDVIDVLGTNPLQTLNDDTWTAEQLRCLYFGAGDSCSTLVSAVNAINAHMSYNAALTAKGFNCQYLPAYAAFLGVDCSQTNEDPLGEVVLATESAGMYGGLDFGLVPPGINGITFSIGCHSGLSVPDAWGLPGLAGLPLDPATDWVQQLGTWVGAYNFAYGDTVVSDRGTEGIMTLVVQKFTEGKSLGDALVEAKQQYAAGLFEFGVYDEKSLVGLNLFGMPQATLQGSMGSPALLAATASSDTSSPAGGITITYTETTGVTDPDAPGGVAGTTETVSGSVVMHANDDGGWYSVEGASDGTGPVASGAQAIFGRPLLPVVKPFELEPIGEASIHGVAFRGGAYTVYETQDPVFPAQTHDLVTSIEEPQPCVETLSPALLALINGFDSAEGRRESFIVQTGQFECTNAAFQQDSDYEVEGNFRIWSSLDLYPLLPADPDLDGDRKPPVVTRQDLLGDPVSGTVSATLEANDESGIREIIALVYRDDDGLPGGTGSAEAYSVTQRNAEDVYELLLPDAFENKLSFQYIDNAGNITWKTLKGQLLRAIEVTIRTSIISSGAATNVEVEIGDWDTIKLLAPYLTIDFGDGTTSQNIELDGSTALVVQPDGSTLQVTIVENADGTASVIIPYNYGPITQNVTITVEVRASGAVGSDQKTISACYDEPGDVAIPEADIIGCGITANGTDLTIDVVIAASVSDDIQYRLILPETNTQIKYAAGSVNGPKKLKPLTATLVDDNRISFMFDAARLGFDGTSPFQFLFETQQGVAGEPGQGFVDSTDIKTYVP